jgi:hypothetical protein
VDVLGPYNGDPTIEIKRERVPARVRSPASNLRRGRAGGGLRRSSSESWMMAWLRRDVGYRGDLVHLIYNMDCFQWRVEEATREAQAMACFG